jgi:hypothetical protein
MSYDIHVVRTRDWLDAAQKPISREEVDAVIQADSELAWSTTDYIDMRGDDGQVTRFYAILWKMKPCFYWLRSEVQCSGPDEKQIIKLVEIAKKLDAFVVGDEDELYEVKRTIFGGSKLITKKGRLTRR